MLVRTSERAAGTAVRLFVILTVQSIFDKFQVGLWPPELAARLMAPVG
jgi:hypothetical protein